MNENNKQTHFRRIRSIFSGSIGNLVEWFDWYAYAAFSLYFAPIFFPKGDATAQLLNVAAVFAVGFFMRPLGGWLLGWYADRFGRKDALTVSILMMCFGSLLIAITPGYAQIGVLAPAILVFARMLQGLSVGGEYGASATYLSEMAGKANRGFYSSFQYVTLIMGQLLALAVLMIIQNSHLTATEITNWAWRIPFFIGAGLALVALYLRRQMEESAPEIVAQANHKNAAKKLWQLLREHPLQSLQVVGLTLGGTIAFYTYTTYLQKFMVNSAGWSKEDATALSAISLTVFMCLQPIFGALSDRIGRKPLLIGFGVLGAVFTYPIMTMLSSIQDFWLGLGLAIAALVIVSGYTSINAVVKAELYPSHVRALGVAFPYAVTVALFGGTAEYVALWLKQAGVEKWFFIYVSAMIGVSLLVYFFTKDTRDFSAFEE
jgi:MHS family alpha-ketoglutarate permease-like MFS transporter